MINRNNEFSLLVNNREIFKKLFHLNCCSFRLLTLIHTLHLMNWPTEQRGSIT